MMPSNQGASVNPRDPRRWGPRRARRWRAIACAGFTVAVLSAAAFVAMQVLDDGTAQRHVAAQTMRRHRIEAIVSEVARETTIAARMAPLGHIADLSAQLRDRVQGERGMMIRIIDPAGNTLGESMPPSRTFALASSWSLPVDDEDGRVIAFVQGGLWGQAPPDIDALSDSVFHHGLSFWRPLLWFAAAMAILSFAAWRYGWRAGPRVRDVVMVRAVDDLLRADYRVVWRAGRRGALLRNAMRSDVDRPRIVSRAVRRVDASWQALRTYAGILDRTETDASHAVRRAADIAVAAGDALFPDTHAEIRRVVAVAAQARWFCLLCGSGAGSVVGLLAYAGPSIPAAWYGAFCVAAGWGAHRLWHRDATVSVDSASFDAWRHDASTREADVLGGIGYVDADARSVPSGAASHGMRASGAALWISVVVVTTIGVRAWPVLSVWPGVLLPAMLSVGVGVLLRAATASARAVQHLTLHDATFVDVDTAGVDVREGRRGDGSPSSEGETNGDLAQARRTSCTTAVAVGALVVGPGLSAAVASGWPFWCVVSGIVCVPMTAAVQAWRWQAVAGPWQRAGTVSDMFASAVLPRGQPEAARQERTP